MKKTIITAILFSFAGFSAGYFVFQRYPSTTGTHQSLTGQAEEQRKILYYRDPMNPEITSHTPKKAADGMDFVPVYEEKKPAEEKNKIAYYVDPMHPWYTSEKPGKAPDCGMDLVPVYEGDKNAEGVRIDPSMIQNMGVTMETAEKRKLSKTIRTSGIVEIDESRLYTVTTRFMGWVDTLNVDKTGQNVAKNQTLFSLYSPDLVSAQEEYLLALRYKSNLEESTLPEIRSQGDGMIQSVLKRLSYWELPKSEIKALEKRKKPLKSIGIPSPYTGTVMEKMVTAGDKVEPGMPLYKLADLSTVWVTADVYPHDLPWIRKGDEARISLSYYPQETFRGRVTFIYPYLNEETRTIKVRIEIKNTKGTLLKPGMFATVSFSSPLSQDVLAISEQAVIKSGTRDVAVVALGGGYFAPRDIKTGVSADGYVEVLEGLNIGDSIVTSSQFLIDSESNLKAAVSAITKKKPESTTPTDPSMKQGGDNEHKAMNAPAPADSMKTNAGSGKPQVKSDKTQYTCEMHPQIITDKPGNCPLCGMTLVPVKAKPKKEAKILYTCEMHPEIISEKPGSCPLCGMTLVQKK